jgi:2-polyprenyl-6-methoxyphenol 4-hydroxylase
LSNQLPENNSYDIAIIGGGMVGLSLALLLAQQKRWRIIVLESRPLETGAEYSPSFDARSTALSWSSRKIFQAIDIWPEIERHAAAIGQIHVSDRGHIGQTRIDAREAGVEALGYVVENSCLGSVLLHRAGDSDIQLCGSTRVTDIKPLAESMQLSVENQQQTDSTVTQINSKLLIIADGTGSASAQKLGIQRHSKPYGHSAIIANISLEDSHRGIAYERFTDQGPMAMLPLINFDNRPRAALVWTQPTELAERLMDADDSSFLDVLQDRFGFRMGRFTGLGDRVSYPLALTTTEEQVRRRLVVIGNAAHSLHPVAGQGFNLSLRDIAALAEILAKCPEDADIGALDNLQQYATQQAADQRRTIMLSDSLPKLFGLSSSAVALGRNSGLLLMDLIPPLRNNFARLGMGLNNPQADYG